VAHRSGTKAGLSRVQQAGKEKGGLCWLWLTGGDGAVDRVVGGEVVTGALRHGGCARQRLTGVETG
jgi:hypothetical protein